MRRRKRRAPGHAPSPPEVPRSARLAAGSWLVSSNAAAVMGGKNKQRTKGNLRVSKREPVPADPGSRAASGDGSGEAGSRSGRGGR